MNEFVFSATEGFVCGLLCYGTLWKLCFIWSCFKAPLDDCHMRNN